MIAGIIFHPANLENLKNRGSDIFYLIMAI